MHSVTSIIICVLALASAATAARSQVQCDYSLQLYFAQDASGSFKDDIANVKQAMPGVVDAVIEQYPASIFRIGAFTDQPMFPLGCIGADDKPYVELTDWTTDKAVMDDAFANFKLRWGGDYPEASLMFMAHAALKKAFIGGETSVAGLPYKRVIVLSTDDDYHVAGDSGYPESYYLGECAGKEAVELSCCEHGLDEFTRIPFQESDTLRVPFEDGELVSEDYPALADFPRYLMEDGISVIVLLTGGEGNRIWDKWVAMRDLLMANGIFMDLIALDEDSANFSQAVSMGIQSMNEYFCGTSTTESPEQSTDPAFPGPPTGAPLPTMPEQQTETVELVLPTDLEMTVTVDPIVPTEDLEKTVTVDPIVPTEDLEKTVTVDPIVPTEDLEKTVTVDPIVPTEDPNMTDAVGPIVPTEDPNMTDAVGPILPTEDPNMTDAVGPIVPTEDLERTGGIIPPPPAPTSSSTLPPPSSTTTLPECRPTTTTTAPCRPPTTIPECAPATTLPEGHLRGDRKERSERHERFSKRRESFDRIRNRVSPFH